ncbi:unnamed protein product, partial [Ectocarpus sp. 12 AP-2014]
APRLRADTLQFWHPVAGCGFRARRTAGRDVEPSFQPLEGVRPCALLEIGNISGPHRHPTPPGDRCLNVNEPSMALTTPQERGLSPSLALRYASYHVAAAAG